MGTLNGYKARVTRALKAAGRYTPCVTIQIDTLATSLLMLEKAKRQLESLEELTVMEESRYGSKISMHPVCKIIKDASDTVSRGMKQLGLTVEEVMGEPDLPDAVDDLDAKLNKIQ